MVNLGVKPRSSVTATAKLPMPPLKLTDSARFPVDIVRVMFMLQAPSKISKNSLTSWPIEHIDNRFHSDRFESMGGSNARVSWAGYCGLGCGACRRGTWVTYEEAKVSTIVSDVPRTAATFLSRDQCKTFRSLAVSADKPSWLFAAGISARL